MHVFSIDKVFPARYRLRGEHTIRVLGDVIPVGIGQMIGNILPRSFDREGIEFLPLVVNRFRHMGDGRTGRGGGRLLDDRQGIGGRKSLLALGILQTGQEKKQKQRQNQGGDQAPDPGRDALATFLRVVGRE